VFEQLITRIAAVMSSHQIPYMIIGGQAVLLYGVPRMTKDIDITLGMDIGGLDKVLEAVKNIGLRVLPGDFRGFVEQTSVLPTLDGTTGIRVDLIFSFTPYERQAIARAKTVALLETGVTFASVEDVVIHKIFAGRPRDLEDVRSMIIKNPHFDVKYVRTWLKEFDRSQEGRNFLKAFEKVHRQA